MKTLICTAFLMILSGASFAQSNHGWCGTDQMMEKQFEADPRLRDVYHESMMRAARSSGTNSRATYTVPVVVHIIHDNGVGNISDAQIQSALDVMNEDYNRMNADTATTRNTSTAPFKPVAGDMDIEFKLAKIDPNGECTNGILRVNAPHLTYAAGEECKYANNGGSSQWPPDRYFNIWVINSIDNGGDPNTITLGYAFLPYGGIGSGYGILIRHDRFGRIETASNSDGRTLTHEMGHSLGLVHIFQGGFGGQTGCHTNDCSSNGDYACDTPPQSEAQFSCQPTLNTCTDVPAGSAFGFDALDQMENYMSYNSCQNMFSADQVGIMETNLADIATLASLVSASNLVATGVNDPIVFCKAQFDVIGARSICSGASISFDDLSFHNPTSWSWSAAPGTEGVDYNFVNGTTSSSQHPEIEFITPGDYNITLTASDGVVTDDETKNAYVTVYPLSASIPFIEGFEGYTDFASTPNWEVYNQEGNAEFEIEDGVGHSGVKSAKLSNFGQSGDNTDELASAPIDLSGVDPATDDLTLSFRYAYRKRSNSNDEWLKVYVTGDCGTNWFQRKTIHGNFLSDIVVSTPWTPSTQDDWTTVHMTNVTQAFFTDNFRCKFEFEGSGGNNFYLDDINIYKGTPSGDIVGLEVPGDLIGAFGIYPNPVKDELNVHFEIANAATAVIEVTDVTGKRLQAHELHATSGSNLVLMDVDNLSTGVYFVRLSAGGTQQVRQVVVK